MSQLAYVSECDKQPTKVGTQADIYSTALAVAA